MLCDSHIKIWNLANHMKKQDNKHQNTRYNWKLRVWCSFFIFFMWFVWFQILICEPQSIFRKLLVLSWLYKRQHYYIKTQSKLLPEKSGRCGSWSKGQIISKGLFGILNFSQKRTNKFVSVVKTNLFVCFLGELEDTKKTFRNYLTFTSHAWLQMGRKMCKVFQTLCHCHKFS